jgi:hypothetical protein
MPNSEAHIVVLIRFGIFESRQVVADIGYDKVGSRGFV